MTGHTVHISPVRRAQAGFSLLELLLSVVVFFVLLLAIFDLLQNYTAKEQGRAAAAYMANIADAMGQILSDTDNFNILYDAAIATGGGYELTVDSNPGTANNIAAPSFKVGAKYVQGARTLNGKIIALSPLMTRVSILLRVTSGPPNPRAMEVLIATRTPRPDKIIERAAIESGPAGGIIRSYADKATAVASSVFSSWSVTPSTGLQQTNWYLNDINATLDSTTQGSYLVYYRYYNMQDLAGDYLYRADGVDGATTNYERNTMHAALNMGNNNIAGADNVNIGNGTGKAFVAAADGTNALCDGSVLCVNGTTSLKGAGVVAGNMNTTGSGFVADSMLASNMRVQNGLTSAQRNDYNAQSLFVVDGGPGNNGGGAFDRVTVGNVGTFTDGSTVQDGTLTHTIATDVAMPSGGVLEADTLDARRISAQSATTNTFYAADQLKAGIIKNGDVNTASGRAAIIDIHDSGNLVYGGSISRTLNAPNITITPTPSTAPGAAGTGLTTSTFGACNSGCGD
ncbi:MAG: prepilin-type N-terminal cleavage/methylation domain-containing protein [Alphaproteobacteria bacterium]|nr:prepilin-type N-terminal cleavage/methylation domain-containing protein [Alphaproteobacteria bacterium]USO06884.1 MAG: prepilin-type N-terminal cleavage/methylation domain-containing protein [Rhodospirillales bacterium]